MAKILLEVGDKVKYSRVFLKSISCHTGPLPFARGEITELRNSIATIKWIKMLNGEVPQRVNVANLCLISDPETSTY